ncbi:hypothetical protein BO82DRAFT_362298 [Aspergillus uvarum CBS 121591]|uniref:Uncharacterized protein n=1 Tax=Aspergillus uvarum CBS 121591 TaxID=1448315 RepID=A0A319CNF7_9EURO|nr:hypothetical protein BO82DRAFT_362298 [Aspergillus uvarum CBS 121591]PYH84527.1 hypothetical protein BO82DRAFT_362298 [Aspergillus uvarum CBS 121591]
MRRSFGSYAANEVARLFSGPGKLVSFLMMRPTLQPARDHNRMPLFLDLIIQVPQKQQTLLDNIQTYRLNQPRGCKPNNVSTEVIIKKIDNITSQGLGLTPSESKCWNDIGSGLRDGPHAEPLYAIAGAVRALHSSYGTETDPISYYARSRTPLSKADSSTCGN